LILFDIAHPFPPIDPALLRQIAGCVVDYVFKGVARTMCGPDNDTLVELGFLRLRDDSKGKADEPLALLAVMDYFSKSAWTMEQFLREAITTPEPSARGFAFEYFVTNAIMCAFSEPKALSDIFTFRGVPNILWDEPAQLVAASKVDGTFQFHTVNISSDRRPIYRFGYHSSTEKDTLSWLQNPDSTAVCFPSKKDGPDAIFLLMLQDGTILRLLVSFKHTQKKLTHGPTHGAFRSTDPQMFISEGPSVCSFSS
jgi:hypothetical protein